MSIKILPGHVKDLGGFQVSRLLPQVQKRSVGPFVFLDHIGPAEFPEGRGIDVRAHPHIGLSTLTYLFDGVFTHRDSLGFEQNITPGDVNWMTAGRGIAHSERVPVEHRKSDYKFHGFQFWVALPKEHEEMEPAFTHYPSTAMPIIKSEGVVTKLIAGKAFLRQSPVSTFSPMYFFEVFIEEGKTFTFHPTYGQEAALCLVNGNITYQDNKIEKSHLVVWEQSSEIRVYAQTNSHFVMFGGEPLPEKRFMWWNFVSSSQERIEKAKRDWSSGAFGTVINETEFIPLPEN